MKIKYTIEGSDMSVCICLVKKMNTQFGVYTLCVSIFDIDIVYTDSGEIFIEENVLQLEYNQELIGTTDTSPIEPTFGDQLEDVFMVKTI